MIQDAALKLLLTQEKLVRALPSNRARVICLDTLQPDARRAFQTNPPSETTARNLAYIIYTSGSTGRPKGVMIPHRGLVNYLWWAAEAYEMRNGTGAPVHSSISFDLTITGLFAPLL